MKKAVIYVAIIAAGIVAGTLATSKVSAWLAKK